MLAPSNRRAVRGNIYAQVLPVPVGAWITQSPPLRMISKDAICTGRSFACPSNMAREFGICGIAGAGRGSRGSSVVDDDLSEAVPETQLALAAAGHDGRCRRGAQASDKCPKRRHARRIQVCHFMCHFILSPTTVGSTVLYGIVVGLQVLYSVTNTFPPRHHLHPRHHRRLPPRAFSAGF